MIPASEATAMSNASPKAFLYDPHVNKWLNVLSREIRQSAASGLKTTSVEITPKIENVVWPLIINHIQEMGYQAETIPVYRCRSQVKVTWE